MNGDIQNLETQYVTTISCMARKAGHLGKALRDKMLEGHTPRTLRSAWLERRREGNGGLDWRGNVAERQKEESGG